MELVCAMPMDSAGTCFHFIFYLDCLGLQRSRFFALCTVSIERGFQPMKLQFLSSFSINHHTCMTKMFNFWIVLIGSQNFTCTWDIDKRANFSMYVTNSRRCWFQRICMQSYCRELDEIVEHGISFVISVALIVIFYKLSFSCVMWSGLAVGRFWYMSHATLEVADWNQSRKTARNNRQ